MKTLLNIFLAIFIAAVPSMAYADASQADKAYNEGQYEEAVRLYREALDSLGPDSRLYYNLGNAQYRFGDRARAIASYERALKADPGNSDARACLGFVNSQLSNRPGERGTVVAQAIDSLLSVMSPNAWAWSAFIMFLLTLTAVGAYLISTSIPVRKTGFFGGIVMLILTVFILFLAIRSASKVTSTNRAVVVADKVVVSTEPREVADTSEKSGVVYNGATVDITDSVFSSSASSGTPSQADWMEIIVDNTTHGWVPSSTLEKI